MSITIQVHSRQFLDYLRFEKRYSRNTLISYENDLCRFFLFLSDRFNLQNTAEIDAIHVRSWLAELKLEGNSSKTINRKISSLKSFFKFLMKQQVISQTPMTKVISPKIRKRLPVFVEEKNTQTLFSHVEFPDDWTGKTDRLVLLLLYQTGMRLSELIKLKESQVDHYYGQLKVTGKGNKERILPVSNELLHVMKEYIDEKPVKIASVNELLVNKKGKALYPKYIYNTVKKYLSAVTTISKKSPHVLRHTFATHLMNNGAALNAVKELLGHSSLASTQVYTHNTIEKLKEAHKNAHPKA